MLTQSPCLETFLSRPIGQSTAGIPVATIGHLTPGMIAHQTYFNHPTWTQTYLDACHRSAQFQSRWQAAIGTWENQIVVDVCCGPGNLGATLRPVLGQPKLLIGIDIALGALQHTPEFGYQPICADAHDLPFVSGFADIVMVNAGLHHCDDMAQVLQEAARLVKPGGQLIIDHDPQTTAWQDSWLAKLIWNTRLPIHRLMQRGGHTSHTEQYWSVQMELHHRPGDGVTPAWFTQQLTPLGFTVSTYPHNKTGAAALEGELGQPEWKSRLAQWLTGIDSRTPEAALLVMCIAEKRSA
jgi:ubiquinone/menaquinone biosynthesis C-methylase UbiE